MQSRRDFIRLSGVAAVSTATMAVGQADDLETDWNSGFYQPSSLKQALVIRAKFGRDVLPVAGATLVGRALSAGEHDGRPLMDLTRIKDYATIWSNEREYQIAAGVTFRTLESKPALGALAVASRGVGGPAIRNRATLGGNLAAASPEGDGCVAVLALPASIEIAHASRGTRVVPVDEFFGATEGQTDARSDELITRIFLPIGWRSAWREIGTRIGASHSLVCCAIGLSPDGEIRIALGGVGPSVLRAKDAEAEIRRGELTDAAILRASKAVADVLRPPDDWRASADYRRSMSGVMVRRLLQSLRKEAPK